MEIELAFDAFLNKADKIVEQQAILVKRSQKPLHYRVFGTVTSAAGGAASISSNSSPSAGRVWNILRFSLYGNDGHTLLTGAIADVYAASSTLAVPDFSAQVLSGLAVPSTTYPPEEAEWIHYGEELIVLLYALPAASTVTFVAQVADYPIEAVESLELA